MFCNLRGPRSLASIIVKTRSAATILVLAMLLALSSNLYPSRANAEDNALSVPERDSAFAAGLSPEAIGDRVAQHVLGQVPYPPGLVWTVQLEGLLALYDVTGNEKYLAFARDRIRAYDEADRLNSLLSLGFSLYLRTKDPADLGPFVSDSRSYRKNVLRAYDGAVSLYDERFAAEMRKHALSASGKTGDKQGLRFDKAMTPIWIDHIAIYTTRMARVGWLTGERSFSKESLDQYLIARAALRDPKTGLWGHGRGWFGSARELHSVKFTRAQAWLLRSFDETLPFLPPNSAEHKQVTAMAVDLANALLRYQDKDGFWHQVADHPESFQETSATALLSYYFARGVREGYLPKARFEAASRKAFAAVSKHRVSNDGIVRGGAAATSPSKSVEDYMVQRTPVQDPHATGAIMMAAAGQLLLDRRDIPANPPLPGR